MQVRVNLSLQTTDKYPQNLSSIFVFGAPDITQVRLCRLLHETVFRDLAQTFQEIV